MRHFTVITLFPALIAAFADVGIVGRARARGLVAIETVNPREFTRDRRATVDDAPYGGGPGMVMMAAPLRAAIRTARTRVAAPATVVYLSPQGERLEQDLLPALCAERHLILLAGRYEGIDERIIAHDVDREISIGDFVVSGGELPAMMLIDAVTRLLPAALGDPQSALEDSFCAGRLDHPHYTRPEEIDGQRVPAVLLGGDHAAIARWRQRQRILRTRARRPDLLATHPLTPEERRLLEGIDPADES